ncbi:T3SS regulon translocated regulator ExsE2 [Vibrio sp. IB15]|uniref:T3SS regulon translocated regulator ExsE2 n=1 Tax=Vibrio chagasii TaxID=170679 RepID=A0A7V7TFU1_9VIBR|nr:MULTISPECIES: T3SS regulon translocated regulator ExsE2 [Vibrio]KAB0478917.1 T3SS regulon translocated regulator ExsE2 [Vibrio chagasii]MBJ2147717.1 T3SS regulon translocated regulator ExsE2 [Vibrio sp. IB15]
MSNSIQPIPNHSSINWIENSRENESGKKGDFLGRTVVLINPNEREQNRTGSKLELSEMLSTFANTELSNSILSFEKNFSSTQELLNRKVQVISTNRATS